MLEYVVAFIAVAVLAYVLKVRPNIPTLIKPLILFLAVTFIWGAVAGYFNIQPKDLLTTILYVAVAFLIFWVLWLKVGKRGE